MMSTEENTFTKIYWGNPSDSEREDCGSNQMELGQAIAKLYHLYNNCQFQEYFHNIDCFEERSNWITVSGLLHKQGF